jgi:hypothetical protein
MTRTILAVRLLGRTQMSHSIPNTRLTPATHTGEEALAGRRHHRRGPEVRGTVMATNLLLIGIVIFVAGAAVGGILLVSWGIRREERDFSLTRRAPGLASQGARQVTGLWVRRRTDLDPVLERRPDMLV